MWAGTGSLCGPARQEALLLFPLLPRNLYRPPPNPPGPTFSMWATQGQRLVPRVQSGIGAAGKGEAQQETKGSVGLMSVVCTSAKQLPCSPAQASGWEEQSLALGPGLLSECPGRSGWGQLTGRRGFLLSHWQG